MSREKELRKQIQELTREFYKERFEKREFSPGKSRLNYAGRVFDEKELVNAVDASLDFWLTEGRFSEQFAEKISNFLGIEHVLLTNSGSSANLLAFSALTSEKLGDRRLKPGDEVISVAAGFPATVTPIIQYGLVPVYVDVTLPTYDIDISMMQKAITPKTKCIFLAHTLGNPFDVDAIMELANKNNLWVIEDNCDAFGSKYNGKFTGTFGHLSTISFYPAHHITTGEGGAICTNDPQLANLVRAFRDWGRDCYCAGGENNTCGKRFSQKFGNLPFGFDHKYVYSEIGFNLKMTDLQAAIGAAQIDKLPEFTERRKQNFKTWYSIFEKYSAYFILPQATPKSDPSWFAFIVTVKPDAPFTRDEITGHLNANLIETRNLFAGNMTKQPAFMNKQMRIAEHLVQTDFIMNNTFFLGTYPGLTIEMFSYAAEVLQNFLKSYSE
ncbi:MAG TPA: lipopolysaccharide biosynthesis protein RfbH [Marinilabiliales bacterium]|nr:MAG: lipopolysaccharide biosynthesis protein RfbH [Bacteroidetes bacterium GWA2_40_14]OFX57559.1 MAG: lipopolysaccharide biosynthesis protein RfbH [Bacteroidetes bacterium GWC2_40_13]OFX73230.1 MAG: lipopolysaccharide biosynthesis protein RfbH [Bacteroidetes bacterium GWD2_40_43]OFX92085.1 MAG: lipopolysaccharide biosynthesis protein RfbH [Bacteroidetes bacterium GWE2_40_63]OFY16709.1 MAG: lipopolysaccharide biosynthesis protein RfbH [Bacteroidetes bacterium GWF2_40_13]OFZ30605.1 MAG: lipop